MKHPAKHSIDRKVWLLLCLAVLGPGASYSQQVRILTLAEAVQLSITSSPRLKIAGAKAVQAAEELQEARLRQLPDLKISGSYLRMLKPDVDLKIARGEGGNEGQGGFPNVNQAMYTMANVSVPLYSGMRIRNGIESARYLQHAAGLDVVRDREEVIANAVAAYYNLYKAQAAVRLVAENQKQAHQRVVDFTAMERNGLLARNDLLKAQLQESAIELTRLETENNRKVANYNMDLMLGLATDTELQLELAETGKPKDAGDVAFWETTALENRADYMALADRLHASELGVKIAKAEKLPSLALTGGYVAANIPHVLVLTNAVNAGIGLNYNLASLYKAGTHIRQAKARQDQLYWSTKQLDDGIRSEVYQAFRNYLQETEKIQVYEKAVEQARENYRITSNKYANALVNTQELLDADVAQLQAGINYEYAKADAEVAYVRLSKAAGILEKTQEQGVSTIENSSRHGK